VLRYWSIYPEKCRLNCRRQKRKRSMPWIAILKWSLQRTHKRKDHGMERNESSGRGRKGKHLTKEERKKAV